MTLVEWLPVALICLLGAATPGPSLAMILGHTLRAGIDVGRLSSISHAVAVGLYAFGAIIGLHSLFLAMPNLANYITLAGAVYLGYLGLILLRQPLEGEPKKEGMQDTDTVTKYQAIREAFFIAFLNPKTAIFFFALFSQFIPATGITLSNGSILVGTVLIIDMLWYLAVVQLIFVVQQKMNHNPKRTFWLTKLQGVVFIFLAINALIFTS